MIDQGALFRTDRFQKDRPAIVTCYRTMTYEAFLREAEGLSLPGENTIAVIGNIEPGILILLYSCLIHKKTLVLISPQYSLQQTERILCDTGADLLLCGNRYLERYQGYFIAYSLETMLQGQEGIGEITFRKPVTNEKITEPTSSFFILFTSGSTGEPKGVLLTWKSMLSDVYAIGRAYYHAEGSVYLHVLPLYHIFGIASAMAVLWEGGTLCIGGGIGSIMEDFRRFTPTGIDLVPAAATYLLKRVQRDGMEILGGRLRTILCGGAQVSADVVRAWTNYGITVWGCYGMTECASCICFADSGCTPGSAGRPIDCNEVRTDESGRIYVRGSNVMAGYLDGDRSRFHDDWFFTGDYGWFNSRGELFVTGRADNLITGINGENIPFDKIEEVLRRYPGVQNAELLHQQNENGDTTPVIRIQLAYPGDCSAFFQWKDKVLRSQIGDVPFIVLKPDAWMGDKIFRKPLR